MINSSQDSVVIKIKYVQLLTELIFNSGKLSSLKFMHINQLKVICKHLEFKSQYFKK